MGNIIIDTFWLLSILFVFLNKYRKCITFLMVQNRYCHKKWYFERLRLGVIPNVVSPLYAEKVAMKYFYVIIWKLKKKLMILFYLPHILYLYLLEQICLTFSDSVAFISVSNVMHKQYPHLTTNFLIGGFSSSLISCRWRLILYARTKQQWTY